MKFIPVLFVLLLNTLFVRLANSSEAESLQRAFNGDEPFFGVAVTRDVENNPPD